MRDFLHPSKRKGSHSKDARPFKAPRLPKYNGEYTEGEERSTAVKVVLPNEWIAEIRRMFPGIPLATAIRKYIVLSIKPTRKETHD